jgi:hypothetical protein
MVLSNIVLYSKTYDWVSFRAGWYNTDFLLVEIEKAVTDPDIRFLGWNATTNFNSTRYSSPTNSIAYINGSRDSSSEVGASFIRK